MKKQFIRSMIIISLLCLSACSKPTTGRVEMPDYSCELKGTIVRFENDCIMLICDDYGPIVLSGDMDFSGLKNGDKLTIYCDGVMETYPAQTVVKEMSLGDHGSIIDVPADVIENIKQMGYRVSIDPNIDVPAICRQYLEENEAEEIAEIIDIESPNVAKCEILPNAYFILADATDNIIYSCTYSTKSDPILGPITFYVDGTGNIIGMDDRE